MAVYGYARVSSVQQDFTGQVEALKGAGCAQIVSEKVSGKNCSDRHELQRLLAKAVEGDTIVVTKLDRFARSTRDLLNILHDLAERGIGFKALGDSVDTTTPAGRLMLQMLAAIGEFERSLIRERCDAGIARAKAQGVRFGRKHALDPRRRAQARALLAEGKSQREVASLVGVGKATIARLAETPA